MKVNELRIGNYVVKNGVDIRMSASDFVDANNPLNDFEPILLDHTFEKILKENFACTGENGWFQLNQDLEINIEFGVFNDDSFVAKFTELHTLQNFYQSVTGKELKVKL